MLVYTLYGVVEDILVEKEFVFHASGLFESIEIFGEFGQTVFKKPW